MTAVNLNSYPYFDDYDSTKGFHQIAFVPGRPIQARELTQIQSILQEQIKRVGKHFFKNGTVILPGHTYYDNKVYAIRLSDTNAEGSQVDSYVTSFKNKTVKSASGTAAFVVFAEPSTANDPAILYVKFINGGTTGVLEFNRGDVLTMLLDDGTDSSITVNVTSNFTPTASAAIVSITEGVYYANGYFVQVLDQIKVLSSTTKYPNVKVGLSVNESIVTETEDSSLYDNSIGSSNYSAPGAHRMKISLDLTVRDFNYETTIDDSRVDFILLYSILDGVIQYEKGDDTEYARFEALLAKRTYEESGNYIVDDFSISAIDYRDNNRGEWLAQTAYLDGDLVSHLGVWYFAVSSGVSGATAPTHLSGNSSDGGIDWTRISNVRDYENIGKKKSDYGFGISSPLANEQKADDSFSITVSDGIAYVNGYRTSIQDGLNKTVDKARTYTEEYNVQITAPNPITVYASNKFGGTDVSALAGLPDIATLGLYNIHTQINGSGSSIGTCRIKSIEAISGGLFADEIYKVAILDISITDQENTGFLYNAVSLKSDADGCVVNLSRRVVSLSGTHMSGDGTGTPLRPTNSVYGVLSNYDQEVMVGGYITAGNRTDVLYRISAIVSDVELSITNLDGSAASPAWPAGTQLFISYAAFKDGAESSITKLPKSYIKTLRSVDANGDNNTTYRVIKQISQSSTASGGLVYTCPVGENLLSTGHMMSQAGTSTMIPVLEAWVNGAGTILTIPNGTLLNNTPYRLHLRISKTGVAAAERLKVLKSKTVYVFDNGLYHDAAHTSSVSWMNAATNNFSSKESINIGYADVIRINSIRTSGNGLTWDSANSVDVTANFDFDNGQKPEFYDFAKIKLKSGIITAPLEVSFDYFEHTAGDYFTVDSYQNIPYAMIPIVGISGQTYNLRDCIDFRIRVNDNTGTNKFSSVGNTMQTNEAFVFDYSYYLARNDLLLLNQDNSLSYVYGTPSITPTFPNVSEADGMIVAKVEVLPYTYNAEKEVFITNVGNKNYTMKEIGNLENRIENVESYVSLSLLEKDTANYAITDKYGLDRLKNGFFVVDFKTANVHFDMGAFNYPDYRCTILPEMKAVSANRIAYDCPVFVDDTISNGSTDTFAASTGTSAAISMYANMMATLRPNSQRVKFSLNGIPSDNIPLFSTKLNVNPFNVFSYYGNIGTYPSVDSWQSTILSTEILYTDGLPSSLGNSITSTNFDEVAANYRNAWSSKSFTVAEINSLVKSNNASATINNSHRVETSRVNWSSLSSSLNTINTTQNFNSSTLATNANAINNAMAGRTISKINVNVPNVSKDTLTLVQHGQQTLTASSEDRFIRGRVFAVVAKKLMPNIAHILQFDNTTHKTGRFEIKEPIRVVVEGVNSDFEQYLKFYDEVSAYSNSNSAEISTPGKTSGIYRSFSEWSGNDYEGAINGQLVRLNTDKYGLIAGWEKVSLTSYAIYIFPTKNFNAAYALTGSFSLEFLMESNIGSTYTIQPTYTTTCTMSHVGWTSASSSPLTTSLGNLFVLVKLLPNYYRTGEKKVVVDRDPFPSSPTFSYPTVVNTLGGDFAESENTLDYSSVVSSASCSYTATGTTAQYKETFTYKINAIPNISITSTSVEYQFINPDPLAQTFIIKKSSTVNSDYVMLAGINVWFAKIPTGTDHSVSIEIVKTANGYPSTELAVSWATIPLLPKDITVASVSNNYAGQYFAFASPVPLMTNTEYAVRIVAPTSNGYEVWTSKMGEACVNFPGVLITSQQADGSLFTSQNASTWTAEQYSDIALTLEILNYPINVSSSIRLRTDLGNNVPGYNGSVSNMLYGGVSMTGLSSEFRTLPTNPFGCNGVNNRIKVYHPRHSLYSNSKGKSFVRLMVYTDVGLDAITTALIPFVDGYYFKVEEVKPNSYTLDLGTRYYYNTATKAFAAETTPSMGTILTSEMRRFGKESWVIQAAGKFDSIRLNASVLLDPIGTTVQFTKKMTYLDDNGVHCETVYDEIVPRSDYISDKQYVAFLSGELKTQAANNESDYIMPATESEHGINFKMQVSTNSKWVTPIIDLQSMSMTLGKNMQSPIATTDCAQDTTDFVKIIDNESCAFSSVDNSVTLPISSNLSTSFVIGGMLQVRGTVSNNIVSRITNIDSATKKIYIADTFVTETHLATLSLSTEYVDESAASGGTNMSKFITKEVILEKASTSLHVAAAMSMPYGTDIQCWYRTSSTALENTPWKEYDLYTMQTNGSDFFFDNEFEINNIAEFTRFQFKFIFTSTSHYSASIRELRIIALL